MASGTSSQKKRGVQEGKKINGKQTAEVRPFIKGKLPDQLMLAYGFWTREAVQQFILYRYGIELSRWQVGRYVKSWGYTPQKPINKSFEQKPEKVKSLLETEYSAIKKRASKENAIKYFGDETGMRKTIRQVDAMPRRENPFGQKNRTTLLMNYYICTEQSGSFAIHDNRWKF